MIRHTLALAALSLSAAAVYAGGDAPAATSGVTRESVIAELVASREAPVTTPRDGEWYNVPAPLALGQDRSAVAAQPAKAVAATQPAPAGAQ